MLLNENFISISRQDLNTYLFLYRAIERLIDMKKRAIFKFRNLALRFMTTFE